MGKQEIPLKRFLTTRGFSVRPIVSNNVYIKSPYISVFIFISRRNFSFQCRFWESWSGSIGV